MNFLQGVTVPRKQTSWCEDGVRGVGREDVEG